VILLADVFHIFFPKCGYVIIWRKTGFIWGWIRFSFLPSGIIF